MKACLGVSNDGNSINVVNDINIVFISKKKDPERVIDFYPISLRNVIYKIVTKIIANKMKLVLPSLIVSNQSA